MEKVPFDSQRRTVLTTGLLLCTTPLVGCATVDAEPPDPQIRKAFIDSAMVDLQNEAHKQSLAQQSHGAAAALSLSSLVPFADWDFYYVKGGSIQWRPNQGQPFQLVEVPEGFVTDLTSTPRAFWQLLRPEGRYAYAAVVHDYLYWTQTRPREEADLILRYALEDSMVDPITRWSIFQAVDKIGSFAWNKNRKAKAKGERRMLAKLPADLSVSWADWSKTPGNLK